MGRVPQFGWQDSSRMTTESLIPAARFYWALDSSLDYPADVTPGCATCWHALVMTWQWIKVFEI